MVPSRIPLILKPTPCHPMPRASAELGIDLWIKRDDLTGFAMGGNKGRKLEYLMAEVLLQQADVVVTCGAAQSNFVRQLGAACQVVGLHCAAAVMALPYEPGHRILGAPPSIAGGNMLLDEMLGIDLRVHPDGSWEELFEQSEGLAREYERKGAKVYRVPIGGSSVLGAYAFWRAGEEVDQAGRFDWLVTASSSGSTLTGLAYFFHGSPTRVIGVSCDPEFEVLDEIKALAAELDELTGFNQKVAPEYWDLRFDWVGPGYGVPSPEGQEANRFLANVEGIFLDPVYTSKAFAGLMELARKREIRGRVLFWHTGGLPALFA